jgi:hypothetical protein
VHPLLGEYFLEARIVRPFIGGGSLCASAKRNAYATTILYKQKQCVLSHNIVNVKNVMKGGRDTSW